MYYKQLLLNVKVCSARDLKNKRSGKSWIQVVLAVGDNEDATLYKKTHGAAPVYWNQTFKFGVGQKHLLEKHGGFNKSLFPQDTRLNICVKTKREVVLGKALVPLPKDVNVLEDLWVPLTDPESNSELNSELHLVLQLEYKDSNINTDTLNNNAVPMPNQTITATAYAVPNTINSYSTSPIKTEIETGDGGNNIKTVHNRPNHPAYRRGKGVGAIIPSTFENKAAAATMNEYFNSLEAIKKIIESADMGDFTVVHHDDERIHTLYRARDELETIREQIKTESLLDQSWKDKFLDLTDRNAADLALLIDTESWQKRNMSMRSMRSRPSASLASPADTKSKPASVKPPPPPVRNKPVQATTTSYAQPPPVPNRRSTVLETAEQPTEIETESIDPNPTNTTTGEFVSEEKPYTLDSLDAFDALMDNGFAVEVAKHSKSSGGKKAEKGSTVELDYVAYVWDSASSVAVSFRNSNFNGNLVLVVGEEVDVDGNEIPKGLSQSLLGLSVGSATTVTITPEYAFGEAGGYDGDVPPNTHVVYELEVLKVSETTQRISNESEKVSQSQDEVPELSKNPSFLRNQYAARLNRLSVSLDGDDANFEENSVKNTREEKPTVAPPPVPKRDMYVSPQQQPDVNDGNLVSELKNRLSVSAVPPPVPARNKPRNDFSDAVSDKVQCENSTATIASTPSTPSLEECLRSIGLQQYIPAFSALGVDCIDDFQFAQSSDFDSMSMKPIHRRKLREHLKGYGINIGNLIT